MAARFLAALASSQVDLVAGAAPVTHVDVDDTIRRTYGYAQQGAGYGYCGVKGPNALLAVASTEALAPVIVATRLRKGSASSARPGDGAVRRGRSRR